MLQLTCFLFFFMKTIWAASWENRLFAYAKTKTQISFAVTAKLISAFVFATQIVQSLHFLNTKFQASSSLLWLYNPVCVWPGRKPQRPVFSQQGSYLHLNWTASVPASFASGYAYMYLHCFFFLNEPHHEKNGFMHMQKNKRSKSAAQMSRMNCAFVFFTAFSIFTNFMSAVFSQIIDIVITISGTKQVCGMPRCHQEVTWSTDGT